MPTLLDDIGDIPFRELQMIFVVERSLKENESCLSAWQNINAVLYEMRRQALNERIDIKLSIIEYSNGCRIVPNEIVSKYMNENIEIPLSIAKPRYDLGIAMELLSQQMYRISSENARKHFYTLPIIVLISSGNSTDDYIGKLKKLYDNSLFKRCMKIAIAIGNDCDSYALKDIVGNAEAVIKPYDIYDLFPRFIKIVECHNEWIDENDNAQKKMLDSLKTKRKAKVALPGRELELIEGEKAQVFYCNLMPCDPDLADKVALNIELLNDGEHYYLRVENCGVEKLYVYKSLKPLDATMLSFAEGDKISVTADFVDLEIRRSSCNRIEIYSHGRQKGLVKQEFKPGESVDLDEADRIDHGNGVCGLCYGLEACMDPMLETMMSYSEVDAILDMVEDSYSKRIPKKVRRFFKSEKLKEYTPTIKLNLPLEEQDLQRGTMVLLSMINVNYWCDSEEERQELLREMRRNDGCDVDDDEILDYVHLDEILGDFPEDEDTAGSSLSDN